MTPLLGNLRRQFARWFQAILQRSVRFVSEAGTGRAGNLADNINILCWSGLRFRGFRGI